MLCEAFDWGALARLDDSRLEEFDIADVNLVCATGLPGVDSAAFPEYFRKLTEWMGIVLLETARNMPRFQRNPANYENSEEYFRTLVLISVLQRDLGVHYAEDKIAEDAELTPDDKFLHGILAGKGGTCANLPVLYVAIGRQLGYPLKLVKAAGKGYTHLFARWDDPPKARFNIEATGKGLTCHPDEYYRTGMYKVSPEQERTGNLLQSMTPRQELAQFLNERGWCLLKAGNLLEANDAFAWACVLTPGNKLQLTSMGHGLESWRSSLVKRMPDRFPTTRGDVPSRPYPDTLPDFVVRDIMGVWTTEKVLSHPEFEREYWDPMRRGVAVPRRPSHIDAILQADGKIDFKVQFDER